jgi:hypothetical protein
MSLRELAMPSMKDIEMQKSDLALAKPTKKWSLELST